LLYTVPVLADVLIVLVSVLVLAVFGTMFTHLFILRVPYVPTSRDVIAVMLRLARLREGQSVYDLGAGDGRVLCAATHACPGIRATGVELVLTIWLLGWIRTRLTGRTVRFRLGDALKQDVRDADVIFVYMMPQFLQKLGERFDVQLRKGTAVISHSFRFPGREPVEQIVVQKLLGPHTVYRYEW
jgi:precorrin-6B methylase 2